MRGVQPSSEDKHGVEDVGRHIGDAARLVHAGQAIPPESRLQLGYNLVDTQAGTASHVHYLVRPIIGHCGKERVADIVYMQEVGAPPHRSPRPQEVDPRECDECSSDQALMLGAKLKPAVRIGDPQDMIINSVEMAVQME